jgi:colanic acid/amylovoran biosynthesis protein
MLRHRNVIYLIGSGFIQNKEYPNSFPLEHLKGHVFVIGSNFGPYYDHSYFEKAIEVFKNLDSVVFRDNYSYELFSNLSPNIKKTTDVAFAYDLKSNSFQSNGILIIPFGPKKFSSDLEYEKYIHSFADYILKNNYNRESVVLLAMNDIEGDELSCKRLSSICSNSKIIKYNGYNFQNIINAFCNSALVISSRHHGCVIGLMAGKNVVPLLSSQKTTNLLDEISFKNDNNTYSIAKEQLNRLRNQANESFCDFDLYLNKMCKK